MHRKNNFDFLRLVLATFVIITHAYHLSNDNLTEWLRDLTNNQVTFSYLGVKGFFVISGYLIFQSLIRSKGLLDYYWKRILRLFPALLVVLILTVILAPFVYENELVPFLSNTDVWTYIPNNLSLYKSQYFISGIFENNPYKGAINGSLWTIRYEFTMYVILSFLYIIRKKEALLKITLGCSFLALLIGNWFFKDFFANKGFIVGADLLLDLGVFFIGGSFLASLKIEGNKYFKILGMLSFIMILVGLFFNEFNVVKYITLPIFITYFGLQSTPIINSIGTRIGDLSYGIYIYGFPVQQTLYYYFESNYIELMIYGFLISVLFGYLSWHLIEVKALKYKKLKIFSKEN